MQLKLCLFGDSVGKGVVFDSERGRYVPCKESFAHIIEDESGIQIDNHSRFGCTVVKGEEIVSRHTQELRDYDYVLLQYGGNDSDFNWADVAATPDSPHDCNTSMPLFRRTYSRIIDIIRGCGAKPVLLNIAPVDSSKYYRWITRENDPDAIARFLGTATRIEHWNEMYNNAVWNIAAQKSVPVLDMRSPLLYERNFGDCFCADGIHPSPVGHRIIAKGLMVSKNEELLRQSACV